MAINITGNVTLLKNTAVDSSGVAIAPTSLEYGQIAINYNAKDPCIFIKVLGDNGATSIQKFVGEAVIAKTLSDILGESAADLATLKDLIKQFEGSSSDVLTLVKNLTTEVGNKANTSDLNAHKNNTSNPHSVTKAQVGLANVDNTSDAAKPISTATQTALNGKLGKTETAYNSNRLGNYEDKFFIRYRGEVNNSTDLNSLVNNGTYQIYGRTGDISNYGTFLALDGNVFKAQFSFPRADNQSILFRGRTDVGVVWSSWRFLYDSLNCNNDSTNWNCLTLIAKLSGEFGKSGNYYSRITNNAHWIMNADGTVRCGYTFDTSTNEPRWNKEGITKTIWNGHNSNIDSADWKCNNLSANQWMLRRGSDNTATFAAKLDSGNNAILQNSSGSGGFHVNLNVGGDGQKFLLSILGTNGYIGVNNENPKYQLDCNGEINASSHIITGNSCFFKVSGYNSGYINGWRYDNSNGGLRFNVIKGGVGKEALFITKDSNVGIDKADVGAKLDVGGDIRARQLMHITKNNGATCVKMGSGSSDANVADGLGWIGLFDKNGDTVPKTQLYASGVSWFNGGNVGFGTSSPSERVHIVGNNLLSGNLIMPSDNTGVFFKDNRVAIIKKAGTGVHFAFSNSDSSYFSVSRFSETTIVPDNLAQGTLSELFRVLKSGVVEVKNNLIVKGEAVTYSQDGVEARTVAAASATRLADLEDVDLTGASDNFVLYRSNTTNANGDRVWKARSDAKSWSEISGKPTTFTPVDHNHIGGNYTTLSDERLKKNFTSLANPLNTILSINTYNFNWTEEALDEYHFIDKKSTGVKAQELQKILPELVNDIGDGTLSVDYIQIIPYLIDSVKQLNNELANKNIAIENARKDYKRAYGESVNLKKEMDALKLEVDEMKSLIKQNLI